MLRRKDIYFVLFSFTLQVLLAIFLGHYYDLRVFMVTGYTVGNGLNPYEPHILGEVFKHPHFQSAISGIGYPPPWALVLGFIYFFSFNLFPNLLLYNLAIKVPIILGNIVLAYLVRKILTDLHVDESKARHAWLFILFNPFILYTTSVWGQFDTLVSLFSLASLQLLFVKRINASALLLSLAVSLKPIAIPLIPLSIIFLAKSSRKQTLNYLMIFFTTLLIFSAVPFYILGWSLSPILSNWNIHFMAAGGLSYATVFSFLLNSNRLPESLQLLGLLWIPLLIIGSWIISRTKIRNMRELLWRAVGMVFLFFLSRSWLSEPNVNLILPMLLILAYSNELKMRNLHLIWILPLVFAVLSSSPHQLLFLIYPEVINIFTTLYTEIIEYVLFARALTVLPWLILGWVIVAKGLSQKLRVQIHNRPHNNNN